jgi:hypothetical protein
MKKKAVLLMLVLLLNLCGAAAEDKKAPLYQFVEPKHFTRAEGVELSEQFSEFLYAALKEELRETKLFKEVISEGEVVEAADAAGGLQITGELLAYKKGSAVKEAFTPFGELFGAGNRKLSSRVRVTRYGQPDAVMEEEVVIKTSSRMDENLMARALAWKIANELKKQLKKQKAA